MANFILEAARAAYAAGLAPLPTSNTGSKAPDVSHWKQYQTVPPSVADLRVFDFAAHDGLGIIAGVGSGCRECWDFDTDDVFRAFVDRAVASGLGALVDRLLTGYCDRTPCGGRRIIATYPETITFRDITLARRPGRVGEPAVKTLIELPTFAIVAPSNGRTHPTGKAYERLSGDFTTIASYTVDERAALLTLARTFDEMPRPEVRPPSPTSARGHRPGDDYNRRMSWSQLLEPHGWTIAFERHDIVYWRRPNKTVGVSATTNYGGSDLLYVFSRSTLFEADKSYSKFAAYTILEHDGDFGRAALALFKAGCGDDVQDDDSLSTQTEASAAAASSSAAAARTVRLVPADTIAIRPVRWLWDDRLPLGAFALLGGREGVGKSILTYTLAADLTKGRLPGVYAGTPKAVIVAATEDSWQHTIVPRLMAAHADLRHVYRADIIDPTGIELPLSLPKDTTALTHAIAEVDARLVILDPLLSRVDARLDTYKDADTRRALEPLAAMADAAHVCILGLIHVNKSQTTDALTLLMASRAFTAVARAVLFVAADPDQDEQRLLALVKNNLGRSDLPMLQFRIGGALVATTGDGDVWTGQLHWTGESDQSMRDVLDRTADRDSDRTATHDAADWLTDYLTEAGGTAARKAILAAGHRVGHTRPTLDRARHLARLSSEPRGYPRVTYWVLPGTGQSTQLTRSTHVHEGTDPEGTHNARAPVDSVDSVDSSRRSPESTENATGHVVARQSTQAACPSGPESIESTESSGGSASEQAWRDGDRRFAKGWT